MQQTTAPLLAKMVANQAKAEVNQEEMKAKADSPHEKSMMIMRAGKEKIEAMGEACLEKVKAFL
jgi:hypothetical protein